MKLSRAKRNGSHHMPCLSALSQAPLIGENSSELMTPISAHSLTLQSPTMISLNQKMSFSTPQTAQNSISNSSVFFPSLPPRPASSASNIANRSLTTLDSAILTDIDQSAKSKVPDLNMNSECEQNREDSTSRLALVQPLRQATPNNGSMNFFSPSQPSTPFLTAPNTFFPTSHRDQQFISQHKLSFHDNMQNSTTHKTDLGAANENGLGEVETNERNHMDEIYHEYHEAFDPSEDTGRGQATIDQLESMSLRARRTSPPPLPPPPRLAINTATLSKMNEGPSSNSAEADDGFGQGRPSLLFASATSHRTSKPPATSDVSEDIYHSYVTLKSNERANQLFHSFHGPNNFSATQGRDRFVFKIPSSTMKNSSFSSVAELPTSPNLSPSSPLHLIDHPIRELVLTESNYVHALEMIKTCFAKPLEQSLSEDEHQLIFGYIQYFHQVHSSLQAELIKASSRYSQKDPQNLSSPTRRNHSGTSDKPASNPSTPISLASPVPKVSTCFLNVHEKLLKYGEYCANLSKAQAKLEELAAKNETIAAQLDRCQQQASKGRFKLRDLLSLPLQRVLKYHSLINQLIKNTNSSDEDYHCLKRVHDTLVDLGQYINEIKRDTEAMQIMNDIEQTIVGLNLPVDTKLIDYGKLITDGIIRTKAPQELKSRSSHELSRLRLPHEAKIKQRYVFVFDKVVLLCKDSGLRGNYHYKEALILSEYNLEINPANTCDTIGKQTQKDKYCYNFYLKRVGSSEVYTFYPKSQEAKNKWVNAIRRAIDNIRPSACRDSNHEFMMHTFDRASTCDHCGKLLLGLYYQGYRCGVCSTSVHKKCITYVRECGRIHSSKSNANRASDRACRLREKPTSPSTRSEQTSLANAISAHNMGSLGTQVEYSNLRGRQDHVVHSFRELNNAKQLKERPASSLINVSHQDPTNHSMNGNSSRGIDLNIFEQTNSYVNFMFEDQPWYCGRMERDEAQALLQNEPHETFLVRVSPKHNGSHVVSLNYNSQVKHMRIYISKDNLFYLSQNRYFKSVIELVSWYEKNSLVESFHMLDACLTRPFKLHSKLDLLC